MIPGLTTATLIWLWRHRPSISHQQDDSRSSDCLSVPLCGPLLPLNPCCLVTRQCHSNAKPRKVAGKSPVTAGWGTVMRWGEQVWGEGKGDIWGGGRKGRGRSLRTSWVSPKGGLSQSPGTWVGSESDTLLGEGCVRVKLQPFITACLEGRVQG